MCLQTSAAHLEASPHQLTAQLILFNAFNCQIPYRMWYLGCFVPPAFPTSSASRVTTYFHLRSSFFHAVSDSFMLLLPALFPSSRGYLLLNSPQYRIWDGLSVQWRTEEGDTNAQMGVKTIWQRGGGRTGAQTEKGRGDNETQAQRHNNGNDVKRN